MYDWIDGWMNFVMLDADGGAGGGDDDPGGGAGDDDSLIGGKGDDEKGGGADDDKGTDDKVVDDPDDGGKSKDKIATGAPESYAEFDIPDGVEIDKERLAAALPIFKEKGLTQEQAQAVVGLQVKEVELQAQSWAKTTREWTDELKSDSVLGGASFAESVQKVRGLLQRVAVDGAHLTDLQDFFNSTGYGNFPPLFKFLHRIASVISEDAMPGPGRQKDLSPAEADEEKLKKRFPSMADASG